MEYFVHMCSFDVLPKILNNKKIERGDFVSFTNGMPLILGHGDVAILFKKDNLFKKGYSFSTVEYSIEYLNKNKSIKKHVLENKTEEQIKDKCIDQINFSIKEFKSFAQSNPQHKSLVEDKINLYKNVIPIIKKDPISYFLRVIEYENEILTQSPFVFDFDDIEAIIYSSRTFSQYFPINKLILDKVTFVEDYHPDAYAFGSPLQKWYENKKDEIGKYQDAVGDLYPSILYNFVFGLITHPEWKQYTRYQSKSPILLPSKWNDALKVIDKINDLNLKVKAIDYVFRSYVLNMGHHITNPESEDFVIQEIQDYFKNNPI